MCDGDGGCSGVSHNARRSPGRPPAFPGDRLRVEGEDEDRGIRTPFCPSRSIRLPTGIPGAVVVVPRLRWYSVNLSRCPENQVLALLRKFWGCLERLNLNDLADARHSEEASTLRTHHDRAVTAALLVDPVFSFDAGPVGNQGTVSIRTSFIVHLKIVPSPQSTRPPTPPAFRSQAESTFPPPPSTPDGEMASCYCGGPSGASLVLREREVMD
jgi:hypothetical protein